VRGTSLNAGWRFTDGKTGVTHVTFAHDAETVVVFGNIIRALEHAVLATDALVVEVTDDAGEWVFFVGEYGATIETAGIGAMVTGAGYGLLKRMGASAANQHADVAPSFFFIEAVEGVATGDTGLAARAGVEIYFEGVLFAGAGFRKRNEVAINRFERRRRASVVGFGKTSDRSLETLLLDEQFG
jgi:hypothetical protein